MTVAAAVPGSTLSASRIIVGAQRSPLVEAKLNAPYVQLQCIADAPSDDYHVESVQGHGLDQNMATTGRCRIEP